MSEHSGWGSDFDDSDDYYPNPKDSDYYQRPSVKHPHANESNSSSNSYSNEKIHSKADSIRPPISDNKPYPPKPIPRKRSDLQRKPSEPPIREDSSPIHYPPAETIYNNPAITKVCFCLSHTRIIL